MKKLKTLDKTKRVKAVARERVGSPKASFIIDDKRTPKQPKHKKTPLDLEA